MIGQTHIKPERKRNSGNLEEDAARIRKDYTILYVATFQCLALNLLTQEPSVKIEIPAKRKMAGWDNVYAQGIVLIPLSLICLRPILCEKHPHHKIFTQYNMHGKRSVYDH